MLKLKLLEPRITHCYSVPMNQDINELRLTGVIVVKQPLRYTKQGTAILNFSLSVLKATGRDQPKEMIIPITAFGKTAEIVNETDLNANALVLGEIDSKESEKPGKDGRKFFFTDIIARQFYRVQASG